MINEINKVCLLDQRDYKTDFKYEVENVSTI